MKSFLLATVLAALRPLPLNAAPAFFEGPT